MNIELSPLDTSAESSNPPKSALSNVALEPATAFLSFTISELVHALAPLATIDVAPTIDDGSVCKLYMPAFAPPTTAIE